MKISPFHVTLAHVVDTISYLVRRSFQMIFFSFIHFSSIYLYSVLKNGYCHKDILSLYVIYFAHIMQIALKRIKVCGLVKIKYGKIYCVHR